MVKTSYCDRYPYPQLSYPQLLTGYPFQAVFIMRALMTSGVSVGSLWNINAAAPATIGVAMLVPLRRRYFPGIPVVQVSSVHVVTGDRIKFDCCVAIVLPGASSDTMRFPGATRSGFTMWSSNVGPFEL